MRDRVAYILSHLFFSVNPQNLLDFLSIAGKLKRIPRTGWVDSGVVDPESVADHSYRTALTAMVLSDQYGLDTCKVIRMALLHDLAEAETGDFTPMMKKSNHLEIENKTMRRILAGLDEPQRTQYWDIWLEYQAKETQEAILVHDADKLDMLLQAKEYNSETPNEALDRFGHARVSSMSIEIKEKILEHRGSS